METSSEFAIIGGGVCGLTTAIALQNINRDFHLFEKTPSIKGIGAGFGLAANAMQALHYLGLSDEIKKIGYPVNSYAILDQHGGILVDPDTASLSQRYQQENYIIHRADLHQHLFSKIKTTQISLGAQATHVKQMSDYVLVYFDNGNSHKCKYLLVTDGIRSALRTQLLPDSTPRYAGYTCWRATIDNSTIQLDKGTETWGNKGRFGMSPLINNRIYWYACINAEANSSKYKDFTTQNLIDNFSNYHQPITEILKQTRDEDLIWTDIADIKPLTRFAFNQILLMGDAAHATTPNMGQGACQALEDVAILIQEIKQNKDVRQAFRSFEQRRMSRTRYITQTSKLIGEVGQWDNNFLIFLRNNLLKIVPSKWNQRSLNNLLEKDFMTLKSNKK